MGLKTNLASDTFWINVIGVIAIIWHLVVIAAAYLLLIWICWIFDSPTLAVVLTSIGSAAMGAFAIGWLVRWTNRRS